MVRPDPYASLRLQSVNRVLRNNKSAFWNSCKPNKNVCTICVFSDCYICANIYRMSQIPKEVLYLGFLYHLPYTTPQPTPVVTVYVCANKHNSQRRISPSQDLNLEPALASGQEPKTVPTTPSGLSVVLVINWFITWARVELPGSKP